MSTLTTGRPLGNLLFTMTRTTRSRRVAALAAPQLLTSEHVVATGAVWALSIARPAHLLFRGRHLRWIALTDRRLLLFERRRRHRDPILAKSLGGLRLERSRTIPPMLQLLVDGGVDRLLLLEFRPRDRALGHAIARSLHAHADVGAVVVAKP